MKIKIIIGLLIISLLTACNLGKYLNPANAPIQTDIPLITPATSTSPAPVITQTDLPVAQTNLGGIICEENLTTVAVLVDPNLVESIKPGLSQFESDLCGAGYSVIESTNNFLSPPEVRAYLSNLYAESDHMLEGAIFIGEFPHAYQWVISASANPNIPATTEETISFQYYSDLDGVFSASPTYRSPGNHEFSYDIHEGDMDWEIWTGVLPYYKGSLFETANVINRYFAKNHAYRMGESLIPSAFLEINELNSATSQTEQDNLLGLMQNGSTAWIPFSNSWNAHLFVNGPSLSIDDGYQKLIEGVADFTVTDAHGQVERSGQIDISWVESNPINTIIFWTTGCSTGNIDNQDNFITSIVYSPTSEVLLGVGTTNDSGGLGTNENGFFGQNIATALSQRKSFGQAILSHVNAPLIDPWSESREFHFATVIFVGDPTLQIRP